ncbi:hypothetical protein PM082_003475 [Marasmius tenuissimus]|nr:hypothetical protein PM082_003475 [Marasmius tenuissimus]
MSPEPRSGYARRLARSYFNDSFVPRSQRCHLRIAASGFPCDLKSVIVTDATCKSCSSFRATPELDKGVVAVPCAVTKESRCMVTVFDVSQRCLSSSFPSRQYLDPPHDPISLVSIDPSDISSISLTTQ